MRKVIFSIFLFIGLHPLTSQASLNSFCTNSVDSTKQRKNNITISFNGSVNGLFPVGDFYKMGGVGLLGSKPGFNFYFNKIRTGLTLNTDFGLFGSNGYRVQAFLRDRFDELKSYRDEADTPNLGILRLNVGIYYKQPLPRKLYIEFYLMAGQSYGINTLFGSADYISGYFYIGDNPDKVIYYDIYPKFNNISYNLAIRGMKKINKNISVGLNLNYIYEISNIEIVETKINYIVHQQSESSYYDKLNFSYLQAGISLQINLGSRTSK